MNDSNYIDLLLIANFWDIPFLFDECLDLFIEKFSNFHLTTDTGQDFQILLNKVLPVLPPHIKRSTIEKVNKMIRDHISLIKSMIVFGKVLDSWIDFSVKNNLVELKDTLIKNFKNNWMYKPIRWPKNLKKLPPMDFDFKDEVKLRGWAVEDLEGLNPLSLDIQGMEIDDEGIERLVRMFPTLSGLKISSSKITDKGLLLLAALPLTELECNSCPSITKEGYKALLEDVNRQGRHLRLKLNGERIRSTGILQG